MNCSKCGKSGKHRADFTKSTIIIGDAFLLCEDCMWDERIRFVNQLEAKDPYAMESRRKTYNMLADLAREMGHTPISFKEFLKRQEADIAFVKSEYIKRKSKMD